MEKLKKGGEQKDLQTLIVDYPTGTNQARKGEIGTAAHAATTEGRTQNRCQDRYLTTPRDSFLLKKRARRPAANIVFLKEGQSLQQKRIRERAGRGLEVGRRKWKRKSVSKKRREQHGKPRAPSERGKGGGGENCRE